MELWFVFAGTIDFIMVVDEFVWVELVPFENMEALLVAEEAVVGAKCFDCAEWVALP